MGVAAPGCACGGPVITIRPGSLWRDARGRLAYVEGRCSRLVRYRRDPDSELMCVSVAAFLGRYVELLS